MKATELRIGNYVFYGKEEFYEVEWLMWEKPFDPDYYEPILINGDWMDKLGFEAVDNPNHTNSIVYINHSASNIEIIYSKFGYNLRDIHVQIKYVHQLQNLYFALTEKELVILNTKI